MNFYNKPNIVGTLEGSGFGNDAELGVYNGKLAFYDELSGGANNVNTNYPVNDGKWHQVAVTRSGTSLIFYVDGVNIYTTSTGSNALNSLGFEIGRATYDGATFFNGAIDDVRVYNRALSAGEMKQLYQEGAAKAASGTTLQNGTTLGAGLVGYWSFNGADTTDKMYDRSGNNNNGYLSAGVATSSMKVAGKLGQAFNWNGSSKYIVVPDNATLDGPNLTLAGWFKFGAVNGTYQTMFGKWYVSAKQQFLIQLNTDNKIGWWTGDGGGGGRRARVGDHAAGGGTGTLSSPPFRARAKSSISTGYSTPAAPVPPWAPPTWSSPSAAKRTRAAIISSRLPAAWTSSGSITGLSRRQRSSNSIS